MKSGSLARQVASKKLGGNAGDSVIITTLSWLRRDDIRLLHESEWNKVVDQRIACISRAYLLPGGGAYVEIMNIVSARGEVLATICV